MKANRARKSGVASAIGLPFSLPEATFTTVKPAAKWTLIAGVICTVGGPLVGLLFTVSAMIGAFHTLGQQGVSDPQTLSTHIGGALVATVAGLVVGATVGVPLIVVAVILYLATKPVPTAPTR